MPIPTIVGMPLRSLSLGSDRVAVDVANSGDVHALLAPSGGQSFRRHSPASIRRLGARHFCA